MHPKTGKVCVPIDPEAAWEFDPDTVCTVGGLLNQLNSGSAAAAQVRALRAGWLDSSAAPLPGADCLASVCTLRPAPFPAVGFQPCTAHAVLTPCTASLCRALYV